MQLDYDFTLLFMIFMRVTGCVIFNPIFGRKNIPRIFSVSLTLLLTLFIYNATPDPQSLGISSVAIFIIVMIKELLIGFVIGFVINLFLATLIVAGEFMDMQIGISMSKIYDPASNVSMPVTATIVNAMFMIVFFLSNSHLSLIKVFMFSGEAIPYGDISFPPEMFEQLALMFSTILIYAVKMSMPLFAAEFIAEMGVGLIMKAVPQINVFVINLQLKIFIGFAMMFVLIPPFSSFIERLFNLMFDQINKILFALG